MTKKYCIESYNNLKNTKSDKEIIDLISKKSVDDLGKALSVRQIVNHISNSIISLDYHVKDCDEVSQFIEAKAAMLCEDDGPQGWKKWDINPQIIKFLQLFNLYDEVYENKLHRFNFENFSGNHFFKDAPVNGYIKDYLPYFRADFMRAPASKAKILTIASKYFDNGYLEIIGNLVDKNHKNFTIIDSSVVSQELKLKNSKPSSKTSSQSDSAIGCILIILAIVAFVYFAISRGQSPRHRAEVTAQKEKNQKTIKGEKSENY